MIRQQKTAVMENNNNNNICVIGGGPAGMMAAICALESGSSVTLFEKNEKLGRKLRITGKGRCNVTNDCDDQTFLSNVVKNPKFLYSSISKFNTSDTISFFEDYGVPLKTERGRRVFPISDKADDIADSMADRLLKDGCKVEHSAVEDIRPTGNGTFQVSFRNKNECFGAVVIATGGLSYPATGSTGDGYRFAGHLGISSRKGRPSLIPIETVEDTSDLMGLTLKNIRLKLIEGSSTIYEEMGEMLFAHFGITGPLVLSASAYMDDDPGKYEISIDMKPALTNEELDGRVIEDLNKYKGRDLCNSLNDLLPLKMIPYVIERSGLSGREKSFEITREQRIKMTSLLKDLRFKVRSFRPIKEATVTSGGITVNEIDPKTMMSKHIPGIFFAGEVIDIDALTGGYNLQIAFSTGSAAGNAASKYLKSKEVII